MSELACDDCRMFNVFTRLSSFVRNLRKIVSDGLSFFAGVWRHLSFSEIRKFKQGREEPAHDQSVLPNCRTIHEHIGK